MELSAGCWKNKSKGNQYPQSKVEINYLLTLVKLLVNKMLVIPSIEDRSHEAGEFYCHSIHSHLF